MSRGVRVFFDSAGKRQTEELPDLTQEEQAANDQAMQSMKDAQDAAITNQAVLEIQRASIDPQILQAKIDAIKAGKILLNPPIKMKG